MLKVSVCLKEETNFEWVMNSLSAFSSNYTARLDCSNAGRSYEHREAELLRHQQSDAGISNIACLLKLNYQIKSYKLPLLSCLSE